QLFRPNVRESRRRHRSLPLASGATAIVGITLVAWLTTTSRAAAPAPATVFLVPGPDGETSTVLLPPELAEQLRESERNGTLTLGGAHLIAARYTGQAEGALARFRARFEVQSFTEAAATLTLPLTGVVLLDAQLDGGPAYPQFAGDRYSIAIRGRGPHVLELSFQVPVTGVGDDKEIRFTAPEAVSCGLALDLPAGSRLPYAVNRRGAQSLTAADGRPRLEADFGRTGTIHVRWQTANTADVTSATVAVQEAYLWDLA